MTLRPYDSIVADVAEYAAAGKGKVPGAALLPTLSLLSMQPFVLRGCGDSTLQMLLVQPLAYILFCVAVVCPPYYYPDDALSATLGVSPVLCGCGAAGVAGLRFLQLAHLSSTSCAWFTVSQHSQHPSDQGEFSPSHHEK